MCTPRLCYSLLTAGPTFLVQSESISINHSHTKYFRNTSRFWRIFEHRHVAEKSVKFMFSQEEYQKKILNQPRTILKHRLLNSHGFTVWHTVSLSFSRLTVASWFLTVLQILRFFVRTLNFIRKQIKAAHSNPAEHRISNSNIF